MAKVYPFFFLDIQTKHDWLILQSSADNSNGAAHYWIAGTLPVTLTSSGDCKFFLVIVHKTRITIIDNGSLVHICRLAFSGI